MIMNSIKISQIATAVTPNGVDIYGLGDEGDIYFWSWKEKLWKPNWGPKIKTKK